MKIKKKTAGRDGGGTSSSKTSVASQALASTPPHFASVRFLGGPRALAEEDDVLQLLWVGMSGECGKRATQILFFSWYKI